MGLCWEQRAARAFPDSSNETSLGFPGKQEASTKAVLITSNYPEEESTVFCDVFLM